MPTVENIPEATVNSSFSAGHGIEVCTYILIALPNNVNSVRYPFERRVTAPSCSLLPIRLWAVLGRSVHGSSLAGVSSSRPREWYILGHFLRGVSLVRPREQ